MDKDEKAEDNEKVNCGGGEMGEVRFSEDFAAMIHENDAEEQDTEKWDEGDAKIVNFVEDEFGDVCENVGEWEIVECGSGGGVGVVIDAGAGEPTDEKTGERTEETRPKPKRRLY